MNGLKVALVGDFPPPHGGVAVHVGQLLAYLREQKVDVRGIDIGAGEEPPPPGVEKCKSAAALGGRLLELGRAGSVVHLHTSGNNAKSWALVAFVGLFPAAGRLLTLHSGLLPNYLAAGARRSAAWAALSRYGRVVAVSNEIRQALLECGLSVTELLVQPAFLASQVRPGPAPARFWEVRRRRAPLLCMAHHPSPVYGRRLAFQAVRSLLEHFPDLGLALFGPGTRSPELLIEARQEGVEGLLEDFGELPHAQALALIGGSDLFLRPTSADGDAISVREALALGVPCVASDVVRRPEGVRLFESGDPRSLAGAACEAILSPSGTVAGPDAGPILLRTYRQLASRSTGEAAKPSLQLQEET